MGKGWYPAVPAQHTLSQTSSDFLEKSEAGTTTGKEKGRALWLQALPKFWWFAWSPVASKTLLSCMVPPLGGAGGLGYLGCLHCRRKRHTFEIGKPQTRGLFLGSQFDFWWVLALWHVLSHLTRSLRDLKRQEQETPPPTSTGA